MKNNSLDVLQKIISNENLANIDFRFCLINEQKLPFQINGEIARPNNVDDFFKFEDITENNISNLSKFIGIGISIQGSNICAIDVDHCFSNPFDISSIDERGKDIIERFKNDAYIEFSFSGTGLRILFNALVPEDYSLKYYIKNSKNNIEFYYPEGSYRYVTLTGRYIYNNLILKDNINLDLILIDFLNYYMVREIKAYKEQKSASKTKDNKNNKNIKKELRKLLLKNYVFQEYWFSENHAKIYDKDKGWISLESDKDYFIIKTLYDNITEDYDELKELFETSPFFKSKDDYHVKKWKYNNFRYFKYIYEHL